jgi:hypothetical protein
MLVVPVQDADTGARFQSLPPLEGPAKIMWVEVWKETRKWKSRFTVRNLLANTRCSQPVLDFLSTMNVGGGSAPG